MWMLGAVDVPYSNGVMNFLVVLSNFAQWHSAYLEAPGVMAYPHIGSNNFSNLRSLDLQQFFALSMVMWFSTTVYHWQACRIIFLGKFMNK